MPYITIAQSPTYRQITFEEILSGQIDESSIILRDNVSNTRTYYTETIRQEFRKQFNIGGMIVALSEFLDEFGYLYDVPRHTLYHTFQLPKKSGGYRTINAPNDDLMKALRKLKDIFEQKMFAMYHTSAYAYVKKRAPKQAIERHQKNNSKWFLKVDFSDFFGSTTKQFTMDILSQIFPFSEIYKNTSGRELLERAIDLCFLNGGLPQGTPISPMLTNLLMIPIDHYFSKVLRDFDKHRFVYTRYADDILISCQHDFNYRKVIGMMRDVLRKFNAPYHFKDEKTHYGSSAGSNWNLGVMLNKDNNITIGHENKKKLRAMICNYVLDRQHGMRWALHDVQVLAGHINYFRGIEQEYVDGVIKYNNRKFRTNVMNMIRNDLAGR